MGLFNKLGAALGLLSTAAVATPVTEADKPKGSFIRKQVTVPAGHIMPLGEQITQPFNLLIEAGVRWHPEWAEPRVAVNAWRFMRSGDAMGWAGKDVLMFKRLLPTEAIILNAGHGKPARDYAAEIGHLGLTVPDKPEPMAAFVH